MRRALIIPLVAILLPSCISKIDHDQAIKKVQDKCDERTKDDEAQLARMRESLAAAEAAVQDRDQKLSEVSTAQHNAQAALDETTAINQQLRGELERLGKNVDQMLKEKGTLTKALGDAKTRLDELRKAQAAAEARTALYQDLSHRFKRMIDGKQLVLSMRNGRFVMTAPSDLFFEPGRADIRSAGHGAILEIAHTLASLNGRTFQVAVYTDNSFTRSSRFSSAWDLCAARAVEIVKSLVAQRVPAAMLSAASFGDEDPVAPNDSADGRAKNRRIEFVLQPSAEELVPVAEVADAKRVQ